MQQDDIPTPRAAQALNYPLRVLCRPVARHHIPHHYSLAALPRNAIQPRAPISVRRTHPPHSHARRAADRLIALLQFLARRMRPAKRQSRMRLRVASDRVPTLHNLCRELRKRANVPPNHKKRPSRAIPFEQIQNRRSDRRIRPIIKRQRNRVCKPGLANRRPKQLRRMCDRSPRARRGRRAHATGRHPQKFVRRHAQIFSRPVLDAKFPRAGNTRSLALAIPSPCHNRLRRSRHVHIHRARR